MKKLFAIGLLIPFLQACNTGGLSETERYKMAILESSALNMEMQTDELQSDFLVAYEENKKKTAPFKEKSDRVITLAKKLNDLCLQIFEKDTLGQLSTKEKEQFWQRLTDFRTLIQKYAQNITADTATYNLWQRTQDFSLVERNKFQKLDWILMRSKITSIELMTVKLLYSQVETVRFRFNVIKIIVQPESRYVKTGDYYRAEIFPILYDSTKNFKYVIENDTFIAEKGIGTYSTPPETQLGIFKKEGMILLKNPSGEDTLKYPFTIEYEVVK